MVLYPDAGNLHYGSPALPGSFARIAARHNAMLVEPAATALPDYPRNNAHRQDKKHPQVDRLPATGEHGDD